MDLLQWLRNAREAGRHTVPIPEGPSSPPERRRCRFLGCVQGVGFRYEARLAASRLGLAGWVRNEEDGSVLAELEGPPERLDAFIQAMAEVPRFAMEEIQTEKLPLAHETGFRVRY